MCIERCAKQIDAVLSVDIGTTALKAALVTSTGEAAGYCKQHLQQGEKAALGWMTALQSSCASLLPSGNAQGKIDVKAICISGNGPTIVSEDGTTLLWNAPVPPSPPSESIFLPRIATFRAMHPEAKRLFSGPEYMAWVLTGNAVTVLPEERYKSAYWTRKSLEAFGVAPDVLPPFAAPLDAVGMLKEKPIPVFCTGPDFIAAMIGTSSLAEGRMYDCAGSSEGVNAVIGEAEHTRLASGGNGGQEVRLLPSVIKGLWNAAVMVQESGSIFVNYRRIVEAVLDREVPYEELIEKCLANKNSDGYEILCHIAGNFKNAVSTLKAVTGVSSPIAVTGGQAKSRLWMQMKSSMANAVLTAMKCPDAELIGDAAVAWTALGEYPSLVKAAEALCKTEAVYRP